MPMTTTGTPTETPTRDEPAETARSVGTTELGFFVLLVGGVLLAGVLTDGFGTSDVWLYLTILAAGYMVSRGLAKARSSSRRDGP